MMIAVERRRDRKMNRALLRLQVFVVMLAVVGLVASVSEAAPTRESGKATQTTTRKQFRFGETLVEGKIQKPQAVYIFQRAAIGYDTPLPSRSFIGRIREAIELDSQD